MVNVSVARRYARALLEVAVETASLEKVQQDLSAFASTLLGSDELRAVVTDPAYSRAQRAAVVDAVLKARPWNPALMSLVRLLVDRNRLTALPDIARLFQDMADEKAGTLRGKVTSAVPLAQDAVQKLASNLERLTEKKIVLETRVDPSILGGASAQVGSVLYDGSLKSQLESMRRQLKQR